MHQPVGGWQESAQTLISIRTHAAYRNQSEQVGFAANIAHQRRRRNFPLLIMYTEWKVNRTESSSSCSSRASSDGVVHLLRDGRAAFLSTCDCERRRKAQQVAARVLSVNLSREIRTEHSLKEVASAYWYNLANLL